MEEAPPRFRPNLDERLRTNRVNRLAQLLDAIAIIDPSAIDRCGATDPADEEKCNAPAGHSGPHRVDDLSAAYGQRYGLVIAALHTAVMLDYPAGIGIGAHDGTDLSLWPIVYIELPTGQVSWHMPAHHHPYDGHTTTEKYERIANYGAQVQA